MSTQPVSVEPAAQPATSPPLESGRPEPGSLAERGRPAIRIAPIPPAVAAPTQPATQQQQPAAEAPPAPEQFTFGGYGFETREAAEHAFKSQDGRIRALQAKMAEYQAALQQRTAPPPPAASQIPAPAAAPGTAEPSVWYEDDALWEHHKRLSLEQGPDYAGYFLVKNLWDRVEKLLNDRLDSRVGPIEQTAQVAHAFQETMGGVNELASMAVEDGTPVYPELSSDDPRVLQEVVGLWREMGGYRAGKQSWHQAILEFRFRHGSPVFAPQAPEPNGQGAPAPGGYPNPGTVASVAGFVPRPGIFPLAGGSGTPRRDEGPTSPADAIFRGIDGALRDIKTPDGRSLGVYRR